MKQLAGKTALVTGASSGIGLALAKSLAARKMNLIITARSENKLNEIATELQKSGVNVDVFSSDLSERGAAENLFKQVSEASLHVDLLINNAGFGKWGELLEINREEYQQMLQLNINALTELCHLFIPDMLSRKEGGIINVGSTASFVPIPFAAVYSASKAYVLSFTEALQGEYGDRGLSVMTLCPGGTNSNFAAVANPNLKQIFANKDTPEFVAEMGLEAFLKGKLYVITGKGNKKVALLPRILSRQKVLEIVGASWKKTIGKS
ncbi:SDR family NAD(P)-dependent oxidoreductase [Candidatus Uabimicrobium sp. HlEnr_7]|uniref:SDR family NAD(P)-dependent oxidoreductase n=1 Tax=Candidatus Uabimicrobium helgolandensis TaxID=3095367 RepID=UPI0035566F24